VTLVSVIIPSYNHEGFINDAVSSVLNQTMADLELVIVDDGSSDRSRTVINSWARRDARVRTIFHSKNMGISRTVDDGIDAARGKYVLFLASDDMIKPCALERAVDILESDDTCGLVVLEVLWFCGNRVLSTASKLYAEQTGQSVPNTPNVDHVTYFNELVRKEGSIGIGVIRRRVLETRKIRYDERLRFFGDNLFWLELSAVCSFKFIKEPLYLHRVHNKSTFRKMISNTDANADHIRELQIVIRKYSSLLTNSSMSYLLRELAREYVAISNLSKARECLARSLALEPDLLNCTKTALLMLSLSFLDNRFRTRLIGLYRAFRATIPSERRRGATWDLMRDALISGPISALEYLYDLRSDLQQAYPEARDGDYKRLIQWANMIIEQKIDQHRLLSRYADWYREKSEASWPDPMSALRWLYEVRPDLQKAYPEARGGDYKRLIQWASMVIERKIDQHRLLSRYADWYREKNIKK
jgi:glycosyltransferase involved in cell wall biosynthesis